MSETAISDPAIGIERADVADVRDMRPLTWILDEARVSMEEVCKAVKLFAHTHRAERDADVAAADTRDLRAARHEMHKVVGALDMVEEVLAARVARAMEAALERLCERPILCKKSAAETLERASFALIDYLRDRIGANPRSALGLFPQFSQVQELAGADRIHPADLWLRQWQVHEIALPAVAPAEADIDAVRKRTNSAMLQVLRTGSASAAGALKTLFLRDAVAATEPQPAAFYTLCTAFFEALEHGGLSVDVHVKRAVSRLLLQHTTMAAGAAPVSERLLLDLLFFCEQGQAVAGAAAPVLAGVGQAWQLAAPPVPSYREAVFGLYDPQALQQCRRCVKSSKESWSALVEGNTQYLTAGVEQLRAVATAADKLSTALAPLAAAINDVAAEIGHARRVPSVALGMEMATTLLFLEAVLTDFRPSDPELADRIAKLAERLHQVANDGQTLALEPWMETLYRNVSDQQNIDTVVGELRLTLGDVEQRLDQFFRQPEDRERLRSVPGLMGQMRGVLSVLGLDHAVTAVTGMRTTVERLLESEDVDPTPTLMQKLGNSLGVLGFLLDTLGYQPALARQLFFYDAGELKFAATATDADQGARPAPRGQPAAAGSLRPSGQVQLPQVERDAQPAPVETPHAPAPAATDASAEAPGAPAVDQELLGIFLDEAREVIGNGQQAIAQLAESPSDAAALTTLRRAFHTLKGSARMVDLAEFSAASWSLEQLLNGWLAKSQPATADLRAVTGAALSTFEQWIVAIEQRRDDDWLARPFDEMADALRIRGERRIGALAPESGHAGAAGAADEAELRTEPSQTERPAPASDPALHTPEFPDLDFISSEFSLFDITGDEPADIKAMLASDADAEVTDRARAEKAPEAVTQDHTGAQAAASQTAAAAPADGAVQQVGHLQLSTRLFAAFVEESANWSDRLLAGIAAWAAAPDDPMPEGLQSSAHALAGSSATVGFSALAELVHEIEHVLSQLHEQGRLGASQIAVLRRAAEAVQQSVAAFAAARLQPPEASIVRAVRMLQITEDGAAVAAAESHAQGGAGAHSDPAVDAAPAARTEVASELWPIFEEEATELLDQLAAAMRRWGDAPADSDVRRQVLRILHTLKGSARLAEVMDLGDLVHETESVIEAFIHEQGERAAPSPAIIDQVDRVHALFDRLRASDSNTRADATDLVFGQTSVAPVLVDDNMDSGWQQVTSLQSFASTAPGASVPSPDPEPATDLPAPLVLSADAVEAEDKRRMVRVRASLLDHLMAQLGELVVSRASLEKDVERLRTSLADLAGSIANLRRHLREVEIQAETQMQTRLAQNNELDEKFDPLEFDRYTRMQELTRMMAEAVDDVATVQRSLQRSVEAGEDDLAAQRHQSRELQHALLRARMVEFDSVAERLYRLVRQAANETNKNVSLRLMGGSLELDRSILDRLMAVFEHLLRNSVVHGIVATGELARGERKPEGQIVLSAEAAGPDVVFEVKDNGRGLDIERIRENARANGTIAADEALSDDDVAQLVFEPAVSTATKVTELAGRGVGLDVVRSEVRALGGRVVVRSRPGLGTTFRIVVPATQAMTQVTLVRMGVMVVGIPTSLIQSVHKVDAGELKRSYEGGSLQLDADALPFFWIGALLGYSRRGHVEADGTSPVLLCRSAEQQIALHVDEVLEAQEVVIRPMGPQLSRLPGLVAITVLASGSIALIYNPVALAKVYETQVRALMSAADDVDVQGALPLGSRQTQTAGQPLVLVVDDSITVRRVMERLLQRNGYRVVLASDGLEGLARLREERPAVVLSDIEMPNMDGYDFVRQIRANHALDELPVVMITSRAADKHRVYAMELGANDYLGKPYSEAELLKLLKNYTQKEGGADAAAADLPAA